MTTLIVQQAAVARVERLTLAPVPLDWTEIVNVPDYSVPDANEIYPDRDTSDPTRRIQPGSALILSPVFVHNSSQSLCRVDFRLVLEAGEAVPFLSQQIAAGETWDALIQGLTLLKRTPVTENGDRLQVRAEFGTALTLVGNVAYGSAEQDFPNRG